MDSKSFNIVYFIASNRNHLHAIVLYTSLLIGSFHKNWYLKHTLAKIYAVIKKKFKIATL